VKSTKRVREDKVIELSTRSAEAAERDVDRFIERRDEKRRQTEGERLEESLWMKTVEAYNKRAREGMLWEKLRYHEALIQSHSSTFELLIGRHRDEVARLERLLGISETKGEAA
jgi:hypothetical protein